MEKRPLLIRSFLLAAACLCLAASCRKRESEQVVPPPPPVPTNAVAVPAAAPPASPAALVAGPLARFVSTPGSKVKFTGTSSLHDWTVDGQVISGYLEINPERVLQASGGPIPAKVEVKIPVTSLKSGKETMDERMQKEMRATEFPMINYSLVELRVLQVSGQAAQCEAKGNLAVAGVTNLITMPVTITRDGADKLRIAGAIGLRMTSFKIEPPNFSIVGADVLKTGDAIQVTIEWIVKERR